MADDPTDARMSPSSVWKMVEHLKGDDLVAWRMADVPGRASLLVEAFAWRIRLRDTPGASLLCGHGKLSQV